MSGLPTAGPAVTRRWLRARLAGRRYQVVLIATLLVVGTVAGLAMPRLLGAVIDEVAYHRSRAVVDRLALALLAVTATEALLSALARWLLARLGEDELADLRLRTLERALALPAEVIERAGTGDLIARCTSDVSVLTEMIREVLPWVASGAVLVVLTVAALVVQSWMLAVAALAGTPVSIAATVRYLRRAGLVYRREREADARLVQGLVETCDGARVLRTYRRGEDQRRRVGAAATAVLGAQGAGIHIRIRFFPGLAVGQGVSLVATVAMGALLVHRGALTTGEATAGALYVARLYDPLALLLEVLDQLQSAQASLARLVGVIQIPAPAPPPPLDVVPEPPVGERCAGVHFAYAGGEDVIAGVDLDVVAGERVVLVGPSGAGKTTLAGLLGGVLEPREGVVSVAGCDLAQLAPRDRRRLVALVAQEPHVFAGTIAWNVSLGSLDAAISEPERCLAALGARWVADLPEGSATRVGPGGHRLTPAQAQQVALARLVAADPAVVILDEATADLAAGAAGAVEAALARALVNRTVIAVAHRLDAAASADRVVVVDDGRIVECGEHLALLARGGTYAGLWSAWAGARHE